MKTKILALAALLATTANFAAPLAAPAAVHTKPDERSATIVVLSAGIEPTAPADSLITPPLGWMAVEVPGPHVGYVQNKDLMKSLDVTPGASIYLAPKPDASVLVVAERDDKTVIDGVINSKWSRISLDKKLIGYIKTAPTTYPSIATAAAVAAPAPEPSPLSPAPVGPAAYGVTTAGQPAPVVSIGDGGSASLPRSFQGKFVSTRRAFTPRRPYDWALNDDAGKRYAYVDVSKLLQTEQIEKYADHTVVVYGTAKATADGKDILIQVESLQLK